jgi:peroxiredoxin
LLQFISNRIEINSEILAATMFEKSNYPRKEIDKPLKKRYLAPFIALTLVVILVIILIGAPGLFTSVGDKAPNFKVTDIDGNTIELKDYRGKVVVLDLMATWCGPCIVEMEHLRDLYEKYNGTDVVIMSIDIDPKETTEQLREFKDEYGDDWIFARDTDDIGTKYNVNYIPKMVVIDKEGKISYENTGVTSFSKLSSEIEKLL